MSRDVTSVEIKKSTWKELNALKEPGDSFDDVIQRLLHPDEIDDVDEDIPDDGDDRFPLTCGCGTILETWDELRTHLGECDELGS